ncbi:unnamed protein product [Lampetra fluviatilis]
MRDARDVETPSPPRCFPHSDGGGPSRPPTHRTPCDFARGAPLSLSLFAVPTAHHARLRRALFGTVSDSLRPHVSAESFTEMGHIQFLPTTRVGELHTSDAAIDDRFARSFLGRGDVGEHDRSPVTVSSSVGERGGHNEPLYRARQSIHGAALRAGIISPRALIAGPPSQATATATAHHCREFPGAVETRGLCGFVSHHPCWLRL